MAAFVTAVLAVVCAVAALYIAFKLDSVSLSLSIVVQVTVSSSPVPFLYCVQAKRYL